MCRVFIVCICLFISFVSCDGFRKSEVASDENIDSLIASANIHYMERQYDRSFLEWHHIDSIGKEDNDQDLQVLAKINFGLLFLENQQYNQALDAFLSAQEDCLKLDLKWHLNSVYNNLGILYSQVGKEDLAIQSLEKAISLSREQGNTLKLSTNLVNAGISYEDKGDKAKAESYYQEAYKIATDSAYQSILPFVMNNLGNLYLKSNDRQRAFELLDAAIPYAEVSANSEVLGAIYSNLGDLFRDSLPDRSFLYYKDAYRCYEESKNYEKLAHILNAQSELAIDISASDRLQIMRESLAWMDSLSVYSEKETTKLMDLKLDFLMVQERLARIQVEANLRKSQFLWFTVIAAIGSILIISLLYQRYVRSNQKVVLLEQENKVQKLEAERIMFEDSIVRKESELKKKQLAFRALHLVNKNEFLEQILQSIRQSPNANELDQIQNEIVRNIEMDDDWKVFESQFDELNNEIFSKIKLDFPNFNRNDLRFCAYLLMGLTVKEIAKASSISPESVRKRKQRLREKLNIDKDQDILEFLQKYR